jgi:hypothetical protein
MSQSRRLRVGDLVNVHIIWDDNLLEWIDCSKIAIIVEIEDRPCDPRISPRKYGRDSTFVRVMMDGEIYEHDYYEKDLTLLKSN